MSTRARFRRPWPARRNGTARRVYTTIYELESPDAIATPEFRAMRGWYQFAPHVRSRTQVIVPVAQPAG